MINIQIDVKFRLGRITFGHYATQVGIRYDGTLQAGVVPRTEAPEDAKRVVDDRGVRILVWVG